MTEKNSTWFCTVVFTNISGIPIGIRAAQFLRFFISHPKRAQSFVLRWYSSRGPEMVLNSEKLGSGAAILAENEFQEVLLKGH